MFKRRIDDIDMVLHVPMVRNQGLLDAAKLLGYALCGIRQGAIIQDHPPPFNVVQGPDDGMTSTGLCVYTGTVRVRTHRRRYCTVQRYWLYYRTRPSNIYMAATAAFSHPEHWHLRCAAARSGMYISHLRR